MGYDKHEVKEAIDTDDMFQLLESLGAEPDYYTNHLACRTICHGGDSKKLYYFLDTKMFYCFTGDCGSFDIFELIQKVKNIDLNSAILYVVNFFNLQTKLSFQDLDEMEDWKIFERNQKIFDISVQNDDVVLPDYNEDVLTYLPQPKILPWEKEGISKDIADFYEICYNPASGCIVIPHRDVNGRLVGIRERTLVKDNEIFGKYRPAVIGDTMYNHKLAFNLYGLDRVKHNIERAEIAVVAESEKSCLKGAEYLGTSGNIVVAVCGSSMSAYQLKLLKDCGAKEVCFAFDADYKELGDAEFQETIKKFEKIHSKFSSKVNVSFLFDKEQKYLGYKDSPLDAGKEAFLDLWKNRVVL